MFGSHMYGQRLILMCHATRISRGGAKHTQGCRGDPNACELGHFWHAKVHLGHTTAYVCQPRVLPGLGLGVPCPSNYMGRPQTCQGVQGLSQSWDFCGHVPVHLDTMHVAAHG